MPFHLQILNRKLCFRTYGQPPNLPEIFTKKICQINEEYAALSDSVFRRNFRSKLGTCRAETAEDFPQSSGLSGASQLAGRSNFPTGSRFQKYPAAGKACQVLSEGNITDALKALYRVDNNMYAFLFDEEVYYHFTEYILHQPKDRLMWGAGRIMHHENLYGIVQKLKQRLEEENPELDGEIRRLEAALRRQKAYYKDDIRYLNSSVSKLSAMFNDVFNSPIL